MAPSYNNVRDGLIGLVAVPSLTTGASAQAAKAKSGVCGVSSPYIAVDASRKTLSAPLPSLQ